MANPNRQRGPRNRRYSQRHLRYGRIYPATGWQRRTSDEDQLTPFFSEGMTEGEALERALEFVVIGVRCSA
ncbi:hypothetical protein LMG28727_00838 [Paraburkholderia kirstenboschensis]|nr:hypothetical protein LMG28727_00838 [Paraburkholderia kirstenboschensis]